MSEATTDELNTAAAELERINRQARESMTTLAVLNAEARKLAPRALAGAAVSTLLAGAGQAVAIAGGIWLARAIGAL